MAATAVIAVALGAWAGHWLHGAPKDTDVSKPADAAQPVSQTDAVNQLLTAPLTNPAGQPQTLAAYKGHVLVVNFWASWCGPCVQEMPTLANLNRQYADKGVQFIGIGVDSEKNVQAFLRKVPVDYPILVSGFSGADLARTLGNTAGALPFTVVIDAKGTVRTTKLGQIEANELRRTLDAL